MKKNIIFLTLILIFFSIYSLIYYSIENDNFKPLKDLVPNPYNWKGFVKKTFFLKK